VLHMEVLGGDSAPFVVFCCIYEGLGLVGHYCMRGRDTGIMPNFGYLYNICRRRYLLRSYTHQPRYFQSSTLLKHCSVVS